MRAPVGFLISVFMEVTYFNALITAFHDAPTQGSLS